MKMTNAYEAPGKLIVKDDFSNILNIQNLIAAGAKPIEVVAESLHRHGLTFLASIRVNDSHH